MEHKNKINIEIIEEEWEEFGKDGKMDTCRSAQAATINHSRKSGVVIRHWPLVYFGPRDFIFNLFFLIIFWLISKIGI